MRSSSHYNSFGGAVKQQASHAAGEPSGPSSSPASPDSWRHSTTSSSPPHCRPSARTSAAALEDLEWTVNAYTLTFAVLLMIGAALGDRFGRRRLFLAGLTVFTGASAAAALSPGIDALIAFRAVQGVGAAVMMPLTLTLLTAAVPPPGAAWRRHLGRGHRTRGRLRAPDRRQPHRTHLLAVDLLAERPARPGPAAPGPTAARRVPRPRGAARRAGHRCWPAEASSASSTGWSAAPSTAGPTRWC